MSLTRRDFIKISASSGAMVMTISLPSAASAKQNKHQTGNWNVYLTIHPDDTIEIASPVQEMGQHMKTTGVMLIAEELDAKWSSVVSTAAPTYLKSDPKGSGNAVYSEADMNTGGSHALRRNWDYFREAGASARLMLRQAAAQVWNCGLNDVTTQQGQLIRLSNGQKLGYGKVSEIASKLPTPTSKLTLKQPNEFTIIGKEATTIDIDEIVTGKPLFGLDMDLVGQKHAVVARCPYYLGSIESYDDKQTLAVPGVIRTVKIDAINTEDGKLLSEGIAVVADSFWAALKGKRALKVKWNNGKWAAESNQSMQRSFSQICATQNNGRAQRNDGDIVKGFSQAETTIEAEYFMPYFHHALMEPFNCIADVKKDSATIITGHQFPDRVANQVAQYTKLSPLSVDVQSHRMGTGFGRRWEVDYVIEAALLSQKLKHPVKVTWMREDEMEQDYFAPMQVTKIKAGLDRSNKIVAWHHKQAKKSGGARAECFPANLIDNYKLEVFAKACGTPTGAWRGPGHLQFAFAVESMLDELAIKAKQDPFQFRKALYQGKGEFNYKGFGATKIDARRMWACYEEIAKRCEWDKPRPKGVGLGIAGHFTFGSYAAFVVEVDARKSPEYRVTKCWGAIDCGLAVNPNHIRNQMEGGFIDGLNTAMFNKADIQNGRVMTDNFHRLSFVRMASSPIEFDVTIIKNGYPPTGVGEPPTAPAAAALANALYAATGQRLRSLPLTLEASA